MMPSKSARCELRHWTDLPFLPAMQFSEIGRCIESLMDDIAAAEEAKRILLAYYA